MVEHGAIEAQTIFGIEPTWLAATLFLCTYGLILLERLNRAIIALFAAGLMILSGVLTQEAAIRGVDFNTIGLLTGMMIIVAITRRSGVFQYMAIWSAKKVNADPWGILVMLVLVTAVFSALLDNVTTVLLIVPVTLLITDELQLNPYPFLFSEIFASNIGGTATLIGDPPNIMIGSAVGLSFNDFVLNLGPAVVIILAVTLIPIYLIWGRTLDAPKELRDRVMAYEEKETITDKVLLIKSLSVLALVIFGFIIAHDINQQPATIAMFGAALLMLLENLPRAFCDQAEVCHKTYGEVEWTTIFFFVGLFIVVYGLESTGLLDTLANMVLEITGGDMTITAMSILWVSAIASALVDNIPFVATMIPLIEGMADAMGGSENLMPLWWALALGSCLGGNGSLVGASANLIVAGFAERSGHQIHFLKFMLMAFPLMIFSIAISSVYVYFRFL